MAVVVFLQLIVRCHQRPAILLHGPLLLGKLLTQHGQLGFRARDGLFVVLYASSGQTEGGLGFSLIAGDSGIMVEYWLGASARLSGFVETQHEIDHCK